MTGALPTSALRDYQRTAIDEVEKAAAKDCRRIVLQLPTGAGKTRIAAELCARAIEAETSALFVVPRISLIEQTCRAFEAEGLRNIGVIQGQHYRTNSNAILQIASAQTLARRDIPESGIVIIDECHLQFESIRKWIANDDWRHVMFIGLTATPWSKGMARHWHKLISPVSIDGLIGQGHLSPFRVLAPPGPDLRGVRTVASDYHEKDISEVCDRKEIVANVIETWLKRGEGRSTLCYGVDRKHAQHLLDRFLEAEVKAEYVDGETPMFEREEIFERFRSSKTKVICNVATLDTGIDLDVRCIVDARPTKSRIRFVQTIGRGLRPAEGKDHCLILDHAGNHRRLGLVTDIGLPVLDDGENIRSAERQPPTGGELDARFCPECYCVQAPRARECPHCGHRFYAVTLVKERDGELVDFGSSARGQIVQHDEEKWYRGLLFLQIEARSRGKVYKPSWAAVNFKEKFGHWPDRAWIEVPSMPSVEIRNWVRSRQIAFAKARARYG
jgi:DNA repair protein RadD